MKIKERTTDGKLGSFVKLDPNKKTSEEIIKEQQELIDQLTLLVGDLILKGEV